MDAKRFFVLKKKNSAKKKIKKKILMYFRKCSGCSQKNYVTELPRKNKSTAHILANTIRLIPFIKVNF